MADIDPLILKQVTVFSTCTPEQLEKLASAGTVVDYETGALLTDQGVVGHRFHLILDGKADVTRSGQVVATIGQGDFVGEIGLLGGGAATATVTCSAPTTTLTLRRERFWELLEAEPAIALRILEVVCRRLEEEVRHSRDAKG
jgi:CRP/FNR family transcriptional regulator, cyclic AMP receptor protein